MKFLRRKEAEQIINIKLDGKLKLNKYEKEKEGGVAMDILTSGARIKWLREPKKLCLTTKIFMGLTFVNRNKPSMLPE